MGHQCTSDEELCKNKDQETNTLHGQIGLEARDNRDLSGTRNRHNQIMMIMNGGVQCIM